MIKIVNKEDVTPLTQAEHATRKDVAVDGREATHLNLCDKLEVEALRDHVSALPARKVFQGNTAKQRQRAAAVREGTAAKPSDERAAAKAKPSVAVAATKFGRAAAKRLVLVAGVPAVKLMAHGADHVVVRVDADAVKAVPATDARPLPDPTAEHVDLAVQLLAASNIAADCKRTSPPAPAPTLPASSVSTAPVQSNTQGSAAAPVAAKTNSWFFAADADAEFAAAKSTSAVDSSLAGTSRKRSAPAWSQDSR